MVYWIRSDSDSMSMEKHLYRGEGAGSLQNSLWTPPYIYLALYILSYNCPDDKGSTSLRIRFLLSKVNHVPEMHCSTGIHHVYNASETIHLKEILQRHVMVACWIHVYAGNLLRVALLYGSDLFQQLEESIT